MPPDRVLLDPPPGTATLEDALRVGRDGRLCEVIDGTLVEKAVGDEEEFVAMELAITLDSFVRRHRLGRLSGSAGRKRMRDGKVRMPDVSFVANERLVGGRIRGGPAGDAPHLAVEVLGPSNTAEEMARKRAKYFASGVRVVWEFHPPTRSAQVYAEPEAGTFIPPDGAIDGGTLLPGFTLPIADVHDVLPPLAG